MNDDTTRYTVVLKMLAKIMEGRPDIIEVKFNQQNGSFDVVDDGGYTHVCFLSEFKKGSESEVTVQKDSDNSTAYLKNKWFDSLTSLMNFVNTNKISKEKVTEIIRVNDMNWLLIYWW